MDCGYSGHAFDKMRHQLVDLARTHRNAPYDTRIDVISRIIDDYEFLADGNDDVSYHKCFLVPIYAGIIFNDMFHRYQKTNHIAHLHNMCCIHVTMKETNLEGEVDPGRKGFGNKHWHYDHKKTSWIKEECPE